jgi:hypothetical protein
LDEDARSRRNRNNDEDSSAQWMPPPPDDDNISLLSFSQTHPEDDIGEGYPSDLDLVTNTFVHMLVVVIIVVVVLIFILVNFLLFFLFLDIGTNIIGVNTLGCKAGQ